MSKEIKHTPAPWTFYMDGDMPVIATAPDHIRIAEVVTDNIDAPGAAEADAQLIAAAPELLDVCKAALPLLDALILDCELRGDAKAAGNARAVRDRMEAAIDEAAGR